MSDCHVLLSGFADEASASKAIAEQFSVISALGMRYLTLRFLDAGQGIKNVLDLDDQEIGFVQQELERFDLQISSLGSPIGKVKLFEFEDESSNLFFEFDDYLENQVQTACRLAKNFNTKLIRGFSFYHPRGEDPNQFVSLAAERLKAIADVCDSHGLTFGLEVEANLVGQNAETLLQIEKLVDNPAMVLIFDGANLVTQGYSQDEIVQQFEAMLPALGWIHIKDYRLGPDADKQSYVDEEALNQFVPAGAGDSGYLQILKLLSQNASTIIERITARGIAGIFADLEPHLRKGGQFGGFSGPDGFGIAARAFVDLAEQAGVACELTTFNAMNT